MEIKVDIDISREEMAILMGVFNCSQEDLASKISLSAKAAIQEYLDMFLGKKLFSRGSDFLEYRLFLLIKLLFSGKIPDEQSVSRIYQTTSTQSRTLIRSVLSKYQYYLKNEVTTSLKSIILNVKQENQDSPIIVVINNQNMVDELKKILASIDGNLPTISKYQDSISTYEIKQSAYEKLKAYFYNQIPE